jgi:hypothetical protein
MHNLNSGRTWQTPVTITMHYMKWIWKKEEEEEEKKKVGHDIVQQIIGLQYTIKESEQLLFTLSMD